MKHKNISAGIIITALLFIIFSSIGLYWGSTYIEREILLANQQGALDIALVVEKNFTITDEEVAYLKKLEFNDMKDDPVNKRLMDAGTGVDFAEPLISIYLVVPLQEHEVKYCIEDEEMADFFNMPIGTPLEALWMLNAAIGEDGKPLFSDRKDIYRYTVINEELNYAFTNREAFSVHSGDEWGEVITGYAPVYTVEGNYVGMLGMDMAVEEYIEAVHRMLLAFIGSYLATTVSLIGMFLLLYKKYLKVKQDDIYLDSLTRLYNRKYYDQKFYEVLRKKGKKPYIGIAMMDIDFFKKINDTYGHEFGDKCLHAFGKKALEECSNIRPYFIRYGGDEFLVAIPADSPNMIGETLEGIRSMAENMTFEEKERKISLSIGAVYFDRKLLTEEFLRAMLNSADHNLYRAKNSGKNKVVMSDDKGE